MNKKIKKSLLLFIGILLSLSLFACDKKQDSTASTKGPELNLPSIEISVNSNLNLVNEQVVITASVENSTTFSINWYVKEKSQIEWTAFKSGSSKSVYFSKSTGGEYNLKATLSANGGVYQSNEITVTFIENGGTTFGVSPTGVSASDNVDFTYDDGSANAKLIHNPANRIADEYAYFKNIYSTRYVISADIDIIGINGSDPYPKSGLIAAQINDRIIYFCFDARPSFDYDDIVVVDRPSTGNWKWPGIVNKAENFSFRDENGNNIKHKMTVVRDGTMFYFLLDGKYITKQIYPEITQPTIAGTYTMAQHAEYSNYYAFSDDANVNNDLYDQALNNVLNQISNLDGVIFGTNKIGGMGTSGFDISLERDELNPKVIQTGVGDQWTYFRNIYDTKYIVKAKVGLAEALGSEKYPKFGLLAAQNDNQTLAFFVETNGLNYNGKLPYAVQKNFIDENNKLVGTWNWYKAGLDEALWLKDYKDDFIEYTVIRDGAKFYFLLDGKLVGTRENVYGITATSKTFAGLYTMTCEATYKDYYASNNALEVDAAIANLNINTREWSGYNSTIIGVTENSISLNEMTSFANGNVFTKTPLNSDFTVSFNLSNVESRETWNGVYDPENRDNLVWPGLDFMFKSGDNLNVISLGTATYENYFVTKMYNEEEFSEPIYISDSEIDFTAIHTVKITKTGITYNIYFDDVLVHTFESDITGDITFGVRSHHVKAEITNITIE